MSQDNLVEFFRSKRFGRLALGTTRAEILTLLGIPEDWSYGKPVQNAELWRYGCLEIVFSHERIQSIGIYLKYQSSLPSFFQFKGYFPTTATTLSEFEEYLQDEGLNYTRVEKLSFGSQHCLLIERNIYALFDANSTCLESLQCY